MRNQMAFRRSLLLFFAVVAFCASTASAADAEPNLAGKWVGTYNCGNDSGNLRIAVAKESGVLVGIQTFSSPEVSGTIKMRVTTGADGGLSFLPIEWIGPHRGGMSTLTGSLADDGNIISGTLSKCGKDAAFALARESAALAAVAPSGDPRKPTPVSGGPAQGHWEGQLSCKRSNRTPVESVPVEADIVQDGEGVAALFRIRINRKAGTSSEGVAEHAVILRGLWLHGRMDLSWPAILADVSRGWRFNGLTVALDADGSLIGTPKMEPCDTVVLKKIGPA